VPRNPGSLAHLADGIEMKVDMAAEDKACPQNDCGRRNDPLDSTYGTGAQARTLGLLKIWQTERRCPFTARRIIEFGVDDED